MYDFKQCPPVNNISAPDERWKACSSTQMVNWMEGTPHETPFSRGMPPHVFAHISHGHIVALRQRAGSATNAWVASMPFKKFKKRFAQVPRETLCNDIYQRMHDRTHPHACFIPDHANSMFGIVLWTANMHVGSPELTVRVVLCWSVKP